MNYITREEASAVLQTLIDSDILDEDLESALEEIKLCIEEECAGYHCWGASDEFDELSVAYREDMWTDELKAKLRSIHDKHSFTPAPYEVDYFKMKE